MKKIIRIVAWILGILVIAVAGGVLFLRFALPKVSPPPPDLKVEATPARLQRGEYLATHVALCTDCHSERDFTRFGGPIREGTFGAGGERFDRTMGFPGDIVSRNITPHNLGSWTDGELYRLLTTGVRKNGEPVFPLMNYPAYSTMMQEDLFSIIAYVRTLSPIVSQPQETDLDFPVSLIVRTIPADVPPVTTAPDTTDALLYGKYLTTIASCTECHTQKDNGTPIASLEFAGGVVFPLPTATVRSANITPDEETGIGKWDEQQFIARFKNPDQPHHAAAPVKQGEFNTIMPWKAYSGMREKDLAAIFAYLKTVKPVSNKVQKYN